MPQPESMRLARWLAALTFRFYLYGDPAGVDATVKDEVLERD